MNNTQIFILRFSEVLPDLFRDYDRPEDWLIRLHVYDEEVCDVYFKNKKRLLPLDKNFQNKNFICHYIERKIANNYFSYNHNKIPVNCFGFRGKSMVKNLIDIFSKCKTGKNIKDFIDELDNIINFSLFKTNKTK